MYLKKKQEYKEQRRKSRIVAKTKAKNMAANIQQDKQMNNNAPVKCECTARIIVRMFMQRFRHP